MSIRLTADVPTVSGDVAPAMTVAQLIDQASPFEPARFEFLGAVRHRGHIDFVIRGDWALESQDDAAFPRVDPGQPQAGAAPIAARFGYHDQERALSVVLRQKAARIAVEPTYHVYVDARQARLVAQLDCRASGSKAVPLAMRLPFWTVEAVRFVDFDSGAPLELTETNPLIVPIPVAAQAAGRFTLLLEARQDLTASVVSGTMPLRIVLPLLEATNPARANVTVSPATVVVAAADNILLTPRPQQLKALSSLAGTELSGSRPDPGTASTPRRSGERCARSCPRGRSSVPLSRSRFIGASGICWRREDPATGDHGVGRDHRHPIAGRHPRGTAVLLCRAARSDPDAAVFASAGVGDRRRTRLAGLSGGSAVDSQHRTGSGH